LEVTYRPPVALGGNLKVSVARAVVLEVSEVQQTAEVAEAEGTAVR
jgi:hypothetical protein